MAKQEKILLESGTNELEVLVFTLGSVRFGVNVAKVREVITPPTVTNLPQTHASFMGVFTLRDSVTPLVDLARYLDIEPCGDHSERAIILTEFNDQRIGFMVDSVERIHRIRWENVGPVPDLDCVRQTPLTSVCLLDDLMVLMIDFESIVFEMAGEDAFLENSKSVVNKVERGDHHLLLAEDSAVMRKVISNNLATAGYTHVDLAQDGAEAWEKLEAGLRSEGGLPYSLVITDIEMPKMDGLHLTKRIKEHGTLSRLPVVIFSSLVSLDNEKKCEAVGADAQITKPQLGELINLIDRLIAESTGQAPAAPAEPAPLAV